MEDVSVWSFAKSTLGIMKNYFLFPYWCRYIGWGCIIAHVPLSMLRQAKGVGDALDHGPVSESLLNGAHLFFICTTLLMSAGLFLVAFAREKIEDEQIWQIRLNSLRWAICINYVILIAGLVLINDTGHILELNLWVPLVFFIIRFRWILFRLNRAAGEDAGLS